MSTAEKRIVHDSQLFDEFLHVTNQAASEAMKMAEAEINKHKAKKNQIKSLNSQICEIRADMCQLENYFGFKDYIKQFIFLVHLNQLNSQDRPIVISSLEWTNKWKQIVSTYFAFRFGNIYDSYNDSYI